MNLQITNQSLGNDRALATLDDNTRSMRALSAEVGDYTRRLVEDGTATLVDLSRSRSVSEAFNRMAAFQKRSAEEYIQQMARFSGMFAALLEQQSRSAQLMMTGQR